MNRFNKLGFYSFSFIIGLWILGAFFYLNFAGFWLQIFLSIVVFAGLLFAVLKFKKKHFLVTQIGLILAVYIISFFNPPTNNRLWVPEQEHIPAISINNNIATIQNFRNCQYRSKTDFDINWETRTFDLAKIKGVDFIIEPFTPWRGLAHTFLTFSFTDGQHVSISVEIRKEQKEHYSIFAGIYWNYEVMYVIGDEKDLIGLRTNIRKDAVYLYPMKVSKDQVKKLFLSMLKRAQDLAEKPEYYNTVFNTCSTNIVAHMKHNFNLDLGFDFRIIFPGYADEIAFDLGLIDTEQNLDEARKSFLINNRSQFVDDSNVWSKQIRNKEMPK